MNRKTLTFRRYRTSDLPALLDLSIRAWSPVFASMESVLGAGIFNHLYSDWPSNQRDAVREVVVNEQKYTTMVAEVGSSLAGFFSIEIRLAEKTGEVYMIAVDPDYQNMGIGTELNLIALQMIKASGMSLAFVATGGDEGHAAARRTYEKAGYTPFPIIHYYKDLTTAE
jgi:ribosomal protein S18 acetylase RimI-like enzyme